MAEPVRARRLTDQEGRKLQQLVRRGKHDSVRVRRALIIMASSSGTSVQAIAQLVQAHQDTVRDVIHAFNDKGLAALDPNGGYRVGPALNTSPAPVVEEQTRAGSRRWVSTLGPWNV
jgi:hypothetical protein